MWLLYIRKKEKKEKSMKVEEKEELKGKGLQRLNSVCFYDKVEGCPTTSLPYLD